MRADDNRMSPIGTRGAGRPFSRCAGRPAVSKIAGFTIVEILITVTIAGILAALAAPSFGWLIRDTRFTTEANQMVSAFNMARSEAAKRGAVARVDSGLASDDWAGQMDPLVSAWTLRTDQDNDGVIAATEIVRVGNPLKAPLTLTADDDVVAIVYQSTGVAEGRDTGALLVPAPYTFDLCDGEAGVTGRRITIYNTGHVSVADLTCP